VNAGFTKIRRAHHPARLYPPEVCAAGLFLSVIEIRAVSG
jgi:hypothetical protein